VRILLWFHCSHMLVLPIIRIELADHRDSTNMILEIARADTATYMKLRLPSFTWDPATAHFEPV
jgi:hypothetical protein